MFGSLGPGEIILILFVLLLVFGAKRLPELGGSLGKGIREFRNSMNDIKSELNAPPPPAQAPRAPTQQAVAPPPLQDEVPVARQTEAAPAASSEQTRAAAEKPAE